ncbi:hypothetical protein WN51_02099 [Melipona quadrifasciata]|uniref:Uncharacterized protein n=1 Tax=Melipona quadrifasciata TaxID=166423 RepID=A0A0M8ZWJ4_9HYME|nr:hypothetical protein WN51_02099 [Melipona quadrifasciata]
MKLTKIIVARKTTPTFASCDVSRTLEIDRSINCSPASKVCGHDRRAIGWIPWKLYRNSSDVLPRALRNRRNKIDEEEEEEEEEKREKET